MQRRTPFPELKLHGISRAKFNSLITSHTFTETMTKKLFTAILLTTFILGCKHSKNDEPKDPQGAEVSSIPADSLRIVLEEMHDRDQGIRKEMRNSKSPEELHSVIERMNTTDSLNQEQVKIILEKYGWLGISRVGEKASGAIFYVVQHAPVEFMEEYYPQLKELVARGDASKQHAAMMQDRILMYNNQKQLYGTQASSLVREDKTMVMWPVEDPDNVNTRREEVGMHGTIEEAAASMNAEYDPNERLPGVNPW